MSSYLLRTYNTHEREVRMGAGIVDDTLEFKIHVAGGDGGSSASLFDTLPGNVLPAANGALAGVVLACAGQNGGGVTPGGATGLLQSVGINASAVPLPSLDTLVAGAIAQILAGGAAGVANLNNTLNGERQCRSRKRCVCEFVPRDSTGNHDESSLV